MVTCGFCGHPGAHATITTTQGGVTYCTGCPYCQEELRRRKRAELDTDAPADGTTNGS